MSSGKKAPCSPDPNSRAFSGIFRPERVDAAKKEKERRAIEGRARGGRDQRRLGQKPQETVPGRAKPESSAEAEAAAPGETEAGRSTGPPSRPRRPAGEQTDPVEALNHSEERRAELQSRYDRAKERTELLHLKMVALNQQLTTFNSMTPKKWSRKPSAKHIRSSWKPRPKKPGQGRAGEILTGRQRSVPSIWISEAAAALRGQNRPGKSPPRDLNGSRAIDTWMPSSRESLEPGMCEPG